MGKTKLLLDVDTGVDDAQGIMLALAAPDVQVLGITCTHGNTALENSCRNTLRVLKECQRGDVSCCPGVVTCVYSVESTQLPHHDVRQHGIDDLLVKEETFHTNMFR